MDYCSQLWQTKMAFIRVYFRLKRDNFGTRHCLTKCALENKLLNQNCWPCYHFSQEKLPHTLILVIASTYCGKYAVPFFMGHPVYNVHVCTYLTVCIPYVLYNAIVHEVITSGRGVQLYSLVGILIIDQCSYLWSPSRCRSKVKGQFCYISI